MCGGVLECTVLFGRKRWRAQTTAHLWSSPSGLRHTVSIPAVVVCCPVRPDARERIDISSTATKRPTTPTSPSTTVPGQAMPSEGA